MGIGAASVLMRTDFWHGDAKWAIDSEGMLSNNFEKTIPRIKIIVQNNDTTRATVDNEILRCQRICI